MENTYTVKAVTRRKFGVSRHGMSGSVGGVVIESFKFDCRHTPVYIGKAIMQGNHPDCEIVCDTSAITKAQQDWDETHGN